jgi:hypothetical protein
VIIDTSAWIEFTRDGDHAVADAVTAELRNRSAMTTDTVRLELLAGAVPDAVHAVLVAVLDSCVEIGQEARTDVESAAELFRTCRRAGETVRSPNDCLIAAIAIRHGVPVLHNDGDFDTIARHSALLAVRS